MSRKVWALSPANSRRPRWRDRQRAGVAASHRAASNRRPNSGQLSASGEWPTGTSCSGRGEQRPGASRSPGRVWIGLRARSSNTLRVICVADRVPAFCCTRVMGFMVLSAAMVVRRPAKASIWLDRRTGCRRDPGGARVGMHPRAAHGLAWRNEGEWRRCDCGRSTSLGTGPNVPSPTRMPCFRRQTREANVPTPRFAATIVRA